jgi:hypothetical protein
VVAELLYTPFAALDALVLLDAAFFPADDGHDDDFLGFEDAGLHVVGCG